MRKTCSHYLVFWGLCFSCASFAQNNLLDKFILPGYQFLDSLSGDLNLDGKNDLLVILKPAGEDTASVYKEELVLRPLLILIRQPDGTLKQQARNDEAVMCSQCGGVFGDPYQRMVISDGYFSIEHYGGSTDRWTDTITFRYDKGKKKWFLHKCEGENTNVFEPEKTSSWLKTTKDFGNVEFTAFKRDILN
jgi:hypothetical protein